ncbi:PREDICTED: FAS-associated death domain protein [Sturnus vulgaris]|uniref:FAS-associated death domain protein n=1 Tax=Sturnus vulgaris TaxID=9172 RepID=UPI00071A3778|nr:PREDICTED: FAS-associated death domain protein [Sturnus vulgaris]
MAFSSGTLGQDAEIPRARPLLSAGPAAVNPFLSLLNSIASGLSDAELSQMKFLCKDKIGKRKLDEVQSGRELFIILMEQQLITHNNLEFLKKMLQEMRRSDLLAQVVQFEEEEPHAPDDQPDVHEKRLLKVAINVICDNVGRDWKKLLRELGMSEVKLDRVVAAYPNSLYEQLFQGLREWQVQKGKDAKVADLIKALQACNLKYAADKVEEKISQLNMETR